MGTTSEKTSYLNDTKKYIKTEINRLGGNLDSDNTFRSYVEELQDIYADLPKVSGEGSSISLSPTLKAGLDITPKGNTSQEVIAKVEGTTVEGSNITINDFDTTKEISITPKGACEQDSYSGKNLCPNDLVTQTKNGVTFTHNEDGTITLNGTATTNLNMIIMENLVLEAGTYYFSGLTGYTTDQIYINFSGIINVFNGVVSKTLNEQTTTSAQFLIQNGTSFSNVKVYPMIATTNDTTWEKYVGGIPSPNPSYPQDIRVVTGDNDVVVCNKNMLNKDDFEQGDIASSNGQNIPSSDYIRLKDYHQIIPNTQYTLSHIDTYPSNYTYNVYYYDNNKNYISRVYKPNTFTTPSNCYYYRFAVTTTFNNFNGYQFQLELGPTATTYVAHAEQKVTIHLGSNYLAGIGDYADTIEGTKDNWKIVRYVGKKVLVSNDISNTSKTYTNIKYYRFQKPSDDKNNGVYSGLQTIFSKATFIQTEGFDTADKIGKYLGNADNVRYWVGFPIGTTLTEAQTQLNNGVFYYVLSTPTEETITDTTLISDLNNMYNLMGYDGQTNITISSNSNNAQMTAQVHYNFVTPAPSPDRESEVVNVTGNNSIVVQNRNFFNLANLDNVTGQTNIEKLATGFKFTKTSTSRFSAWFDNFIPSGTYKFVGTFTTNDTETSHRLAVQFLFDDNTQTDSYINLNNIPLTLDKNVKRIRLYAQSSFNNDNWYQYENFMLLKSTETDTTYVAHAEQTLPLNLGNNYLAKLGDYQDYIYGKTDDWKIKRNVDKSTISVTGFYTNTSTNRRYCFWNKPSTAQDYNQYSTNMLSEVGGGGGADTTHYAINYVVGAYTDAEITSLINNKKFYYALAEETEETITDQTLINQLNAIYAATGYEGITNIIITSDSSNAQMTALVSALKGE